MPTYDGTIPVQSNSVRGAAGDLVKMQGNFELLEPAGNAFASDGDLTVSGDTLTLRHNVNAPAAVVVDTGQSIDQDGIVRFRNQNTNTRWEMRYDAATKFLKFSSFFGGEHEILNLESNGSTIKRLVVPIAAISDFPTIVGSGSLFAGIMFLGGNKIGFRLSTHNVHFTSSGAGFNAIADPTEDIDVGGDIRVRGGQVVDLVENIDLFHASLVSGDTRVIRQSAHYPVDITSMVVEAVGGSAVEVDVRIDGTPITGLDNVLVDTTERTHTGTAANTLAVGGKLDVTVVSGGVAATDVAISFLTKRIT